MTHCQSLPNPPKFWSGFIENPKIELKLTNLSVMILWHPFDRPKKSFSLVQNFCNDNSIKKLKWHWNYFVCVEIKNVNSTCWYHIIKTVQHKEMQAKCITSIIGVLTFRAKIKHSGTWCDINYIFSQIAWSLCMKLKNVFHCEDNFDECKQCNGSGISFLPLKNHAKLKNEKTTSPQLVVFRLQENIILIIPNNHDM